MMEFQKATLSEEYEFLKEEARQMECENKIAARKNLYFRSRSTLEERKKLIKTTLIGTVVTFIFVIILSLILYSINKPFSAENILLSLNWGILAAGCFFVIVPGTPYLKYVECLPSVPIFLHIITGGLILALYLMITMATLLLGIPIFILEFTVLTIRCKKIEKEFQ